MKKIQSNIIL